MKITRTGETTDQLMNPDAGLWNGLETRLFYMAPAPLNGNPDIKKISPFLEKSTDHGTVRELSVVGVHNGDSLALRLSWPSGKNDKIADLDQFVDGVAVMFPLTAKASAVTMGSKSDPVNAWYWKANLDGVAFEVLAEGYGTSARQQGEGKSQVIAGAVHREGHWHVVLSRPMDIGSGRARFKAGQPAKLAFCVWDGANRERAGRKSFSGDFVPVTLDL
jgi:ethylbenzene hydroxylase subunit gamma/complex iron-sulfur molybdoenzyme family reductase subunit gamma